MDSLMLCTRGRLPLLSVYGRWAYHLKEKQLEAIHSFLDGRDTTTRSILLPLELGYDTIEPQPIVHKHRVSACVLSPPSFPSSGYRHLLSFHNCEFFTHPVWGGCQNNSTIGTLSPREDLATASPRPVFADCDFLGMRITAKATW